MNDSFGLRGLRFRGDFVKFIQYLADKPSLGYIFE